MGSIRMPLLGQDVNGAIMFTEPLYGKHHKGNCWIVKESLLIEEIATQDIHLRMCQSCVHFSELQIS